ncbi:MAG TPA: exodeoxyribonuclease VII large subunit [Mycobacteriales bacterium]|jgi:exodeoxyribonuclease VII large subunit|nr:exodeoxyribonuclease VII large subunit [Mycobacteriales bacterium]
MTSPTTAETPWPVRTVARKIAEWVNRLGEVWVEGQIAQLTRRPGTRTAFLVLRDPAADVSLTVSCPVDLLDPALREGARVVVRARPDLYLTRGSLSLRASEIRHVGVGELLARLERLKRMLAAEGLFNADRKRRLPFLPSCIGLITGRASAAERDVRENAVARWPAVQFAVENVAVQGVDSVIGMIAALERLDKKPDVDVIVLARGGGSVEDLLPFSDEALCRAVAAARTPVVSAIGHEQDSPLLDLVADLRCSTPTDAGKRLVPAVAEEQARLVELRGRARRAVSVRLDSEAQRIAALRARPVLADPAQVLDRRGAELNDLRDRSARCLSHRLDAAAADLGHTRSRVRALSPAATLARGYAVVQQSDGTVVRRAADVPAGSALRLRLADGTLRATTSEEADGD